MTLERLLKEEPNTYTIAVRWAKNGRKYIIDLTKKLTKQQLNYEVEQVIEEDGVVWLYR